MTILLLTTGTSFTFPRERRLKEDEGRGLRPRRGQPLVAAETWHHIVGGPTELKLRDSPSHF